MTIKYLKQLRILAASVTIFGAIIPSITMAGIFSWLPIYGVGLSDKGFTVNGSMFYASSRPVINSEETKTKPVIVNETAFMQTSNITTSYVKTSNDKSKKMTFVATAYSSTPDQTDDSPFITAKGTHVRDGIIATNVLPFNTLIKMPELYGDKVFVVEDRMNSRYNGKNRLDVWFPDRQTAIQFGAKTVAVEVIGSI